MSVEFPSNEKNGLWRESFAAEGAGRCRVLLQRGGANGLEWPCQFTLKMGDNSTLHSSGILEA